MYRRILALMLLIALIVMFIPNVNAQSGDPIRIGIVTSSSGNHANFGDAQARGYELAVRTINDAGGVLGRPLSLAFRNDNSDPDMAAAMVEELIVEQGITVLIGAYSSSATLPAVEVANSLEVPMVVPTAASSAITTQGYEWIFRINAPSTIYASTMMDFLYTNGAVERMAVIYENTAFGSSTSDAVLAYAGQFGIEVVSLESYDAGSEDYSALLNRVKDADPQVIFFASYLEDATLLMQQAEALDINAAAFAAGGAGFSLPDFPELAGPNAEFTLSVTQWTPDVSWPGAAEFTDLFTATYGMPPQYHSAETYAALFVVADAIERAGTADDPEAIRDALRETDMDTIFGPVRFAANGQNAHPVLVTQVLNGEFITVWPSDAATIAPVFPAPAWTGRADFVYPEVPEIIPATDAEATDTPDSTGS